MSRAKEFVRYALSIGALELVPEGRKLKSGRISPYFFNSGLFNTGDSITELIKAYVSADTFFVEAEVVFGPAYKGIPLATAMAMAMSIKYKTRVGYAFNRKEEKKHGDGGTIVGCPLAGKKVLIIDDVMTTGTSSGEAVEIIRANGGTPIGCVIAFDRQECGKDGRLSAVQEFERNYGIPVRAAATLADLIDVVNNDGGYVSREKAAILEKILAYRKQYGV
ncbi:MAG: orotate phosphoribosyltransferase [Patescibacteria group bacterium]